MDFKNVFLQGNRVLLLVALFVIFVIGLLLANIGFGFYPVISWSLFFIFLLPWLTWFAWRIPRFGFKKRLFINIMILSYCLFAITTGGIVVYYEGGFGGNWEEVVVEGPMSWSLWIDDEGISAFPLICWIYHNKRPPYTIEMLLRDETKNTRGINIETVTVEYNGGSKSKHTINWSREFIDWNTSMLLNAKLSNIIDKTQTCSIEFEGNYIDSSGRKNPFKVRTKEKIEYAKPELKPRIYTLWSGMHD